MNTFARVTGVVAIPLGGFLATGSWLLAHDRELELSTPVLGAFLFLMQPGYVVEGLRQQMFGIPGSNTVTHVSMWVLSTLFWSAVLGAIAWIGQKALGRR